MNIIVFAKGVKAPEEGELKILEDGKDIDLSRLPFKLNDWDNYALEEGVRIVEKSGGNLVAISIGGKESDEVLRRSIAMGASEGILLMREEVIHDPALKAHLAFEFIKKENIPFDAIFTGVQAEDDQFAAFGGYLAALLDLPYVSMVIEIEELTKEHAIVKREIEGGKLERIEVSMPSVFSLQTGINEPRYVSVMGIRRASKVERKIYDASLYTEGLKYSIHLLKWSYPQKKEGAKILSSDISRACEELLTILKEKGVYQ